MTVEERERINKERKERKRVRVLEKMGRTPVNDIVLQVQDGIIDIKDVLFYIDTRLKEGHNNG